MLRGRLRRLRALLECSGPARVRRRRSVLLTLVERFPTHCGRHPKTVTEVEVLAAALG
jgi:hypothetical protein